MPSPPRTSRRWLRQSPRTSNVTRVLCASPTPLDLRPQPQTRSSRSEVDDGPCCCLCTRTLVRGPNPRKPATPLRVNLIPGTATPRKTWIHRGRVPRCRAGCGRTRERRWPGVRCGADRRGQSPRSPGSTSPGRGCATAASKRVSEGRQRLVFIISIPVSGLGGDVNLQTPCGRRRAAVAGQLRRIRPLMAR